MEAKLVDIISGELAIKPVYVKNTLNLLEHGATVPFISRYRKEMTGSLDEVFVTSIRDRYGKLLEIEKRRESILKSISEQGKLTDALRVQIEQAGELNELEDLYLPYKPKKRTRAAMAREKGLEPLATAIMLQQVDDVEALAGKFITEKVPDTGEALQGARDIMAEWVNENQDARNRIRNLYAREAVIYSSVVKSKEEEGAKYLDYFDFSELLRKCVSHRFLAMLRGEDEGFLRLRIEPPEEKALELLEGLFMKSRKRSAAEVKKAIHDSYHRLLGPSMENEFRASHKETSDDEAIRVFAENLRQLLLAPPLGQKAVLAIDPGYRTGCKVTCLDAQGNLVHNETIYPHPPQNNSARASVQVMDMVKDFGIEAIAIGNGTAGRETEAFIRSLPFDRDIKIFMVSENGASVYSASEVAREEFPDYDVTVRGAVSIGRRLMDPLAELVKIDPKSIGVGQYQHDVDQAKLKESLDQVVESCVNLVGVNVNTATRQILTYISGLGPQLAGNIVQYRMEHGPFLSRTELKRVPRMGEKAFEQSAGFLRIAGGKNSLDNSAVHPESYSVVKQMVSDLGVTVSDILRDEKLRRTIDLRNYVTETVGLPTLQDIMAELAKPGRDPRASIKVFEFDPGVHTLDDLKPGMVLPGIVTNITNFGAFVDVGVKQDGLVHISQLANRYIKDPSEVVKLHQQVKVKVLEVDVIRKRISLTMKNL